MKRLLVLLAIAAAAVAVEVTSATAASANARVVITFEKHWVEPGHYQGLTGDGCTLDVYMSDDSVTGNVQRFTATFEITSCADHDLTAVVAGIFDFTTGKTALNGTVTDGWLTGAQAHEQGQLVRVDPYTFVGTLQLMPA
jgi:hypothetical protein